MALLSFRVEPLTDTQLLLHDQKPISPSMSALPTQVFIQFVYKVNHQFYLYPKDSYRYIHLDDRDHQEIKQVENTQFDLWMVDHSNISYPLLFRKLSSLGVDPSLHSSVVDLITLYCKTSGYWQYINMSGWPVLPLSVTIEEAHHMIYCETCYELIGLEEEEVEFEEEDDYYEEVIGMIPSNESSIKELLKRVRVGGNEKDVCTVCLEELSSSEGGVSYAMEMPCKHVFHDECVVRWLKESHYCPVCRFEMPTAY